MVYVQSEHHRGISVAFVVGLAAVVYVVVYSAANDKISAEIEAPQTEVVVKLENTTELDDNAERAENAGDVRMEMWVVLITSITALMVASFGAAIWVRLAEVESLRSQIFQLQSQHKAEHDAHVAEANKQQAALRQSEEELRAEREKIAKLQTQHKTEVQGHVDHIAGLEKRLLKLDPPQQPYDERRQREDLRQRLPEAEREHFDQFLRNDPKLKLWGFEGSQITDDDAKCLADALKLNTELETLALLRDEITDDGAKYFADALKANQMLKVLGIAGNQVTDEGVKHFADALKENNKLITLGLVGNQITDNGAKSLADALKENATLQGLLLNNNEITNEGADQLAAALQVNKTLISLELFDNKITNDGVKRWNRALMESSVTSESDLPEMSSPVKSPRRCGV